MGHFDQHYNFVVNRKSRPTSNPENTKTLTDTNSQSSSVSNTKACKKPHVQELPERAIKPKAVTKSKGSSASGVKPAKKPNVEITTSSKAITNADIIVTSDTAEMKITIKSNRSVELIRINFDTGDDH
ncbi:hypothetical protein BDF21DRAFT_450023 [Thamnidium elegans]|nr:hypothetical protein BDF21DRAFT_450023 [Thamnidium elegans]